MSEEDTKAPAVEGQEDHAPVKEEESTATFEPVVRLEEVETLSGEEEEEVLYSQRTKLFVYAETLLEKGTGNRTWNERGVGNIRVLKHKEHGRCRLLMRQEKTMKPIVNHLIVPGLMIQPHPNSDRALVWRANDFADGEVVETSFCARFVDSDVASSFKEQFEKYVQEMTNLANGKDTPGDDNGAAADEAAEALAGLSTKEEEKE